MARAKESVYFYFVRVPLWTAIALLLVMGVVSKRGWLDFRRILRQTQDLQSKIEVTQKHRDDLERQIQALKSDPGEQERVVRQMLGYVRPDETVVEFE